jgi:hypothetical protein
MSNTQTSILRAFPSLRFRIFTKCWAGGMPPLWELQFQAQQQQMSLNVGFALKQLGL